MIDTMIITRYDTGVEIREIYGVEQFWDLGVLLGISRVQGRSPGKFF